MPLAQPDPKVQRVKPVQLVLLALKVPLAQLGLKALLDLPV